MKLTKEQILKANKEELLKIRDELNVKNSCDSCDSCDSCSSCNSCFSCFSCDLCKNVCNGLFCKELIFQNKNYNKYYICNIEVTKEEFEKKLKEVGNNNHS